MDVPAQCREVGLHDLLGTLPTQPILRFYELQFEELQRKGNTKLFFSQPLSPSAVGGRAALSAVSSGPAAWGRARAGIRGALRGADRPPVPGARTAPRALPLLGAPVGPGGPELEPGAGQFRDVAARGRCRHALRCAPVSRSPVRCVGWVRGERNDFPPG